MEVFSLRVYLHTTYMPGGCGGWERVTSPATRVIDGYKPRECWTWNSGSLEELPVLLITDPSLQP